MSKNETQSLTEKMTGILLTRLALVRQGQERKPAVDAALVESIRKINQELERFTDEVRRIDAGSSAEATCLARIRELEDMRFQLLSQMNGNRLEEYNTLAPRYPHQ